MHETEQQFMKKHGFERRKISRLIALDEFSASYNLTVIKTMMFFYILLHK